MTRHHTFIDYGITPTVGRASPIELAGSNGNYSYRFTASISIEELRQLISDNKLGISVVEEGPHYATCLRGWNLAKGQIRIKVGADALEFSTTSITYSKAGLLETSMLKDMHAVILGEAVQLEEIANAAGCLFRGARPEMAKRLLKVIGITDPEEVHEIGKLYRTTFTGTSGEMRAISFARALLRECVERVDRGEIQLKMDGKVRGVITQTMEELPIVNDYTVQRTTAHESRILPIRRL